MARALGVSLRVVATFAFAFVLATPIAGLVACGETRRPIGEECLRSDDCLSGICSAGTCVSAPSFVSGASPGDPGDEPRIPAPGEGGAVGVDAAGDGKGDGG